MVTGPDIVVALDISLLSAQLPPTPASTLLGCSIRYLPPAFAWTWKKAPRGASSAQSFPGYFHCCTGHELAAVEILAPVMPRQSSLRSAAGDRGLDNHRVNGGRCHVDLLGDVGDVLFPLVLPQWCEDLRGVPRRRDSFFHGVDAPSLCEAMVDYGPSQVWTVLDGLDDREFTVV